MEAMNEFKTLVDEGMSLLKRAVVFQQENHLDENECENYVESVLTNLDEDLAEQFPKLTLDPSVG